jgi:hypothetical protein
MLYYVFANNIFEPANWNEYGEALVLFGDCLFLIDILCNPLALVYGLYPADNFWMFYEPVLKLCGLKARNTRPLVSIPLESSVSTQQSNL